MFFGTSVILSACVGKTYKLTSGEVSNLSNNKKNTPSQKIREISDKLDSQNKTVSLQIIDVSSERAILELSNKTDNSIYLFYSTSKNKDLNSEVFHYWFRCKEKGNKEIDYNSLTSHILPNLEPLKKEESFRFEINPLPKVNADCKISVLYYDDKEVVDLINNKPLDMDKSEYNTAERAKKSVELQFEVNNKSDAIP